MEIKTLEQYAVTRIQDLENEVEKLKKEVSTLNKDIDSFIKLVNTIAERASIKTLAYDKYISFDSVWYSSYDPDSYNIIKDGLCLVEPEKVEEKVDE